jgi:ATP-binding cassette, subfamily B, bacterial MsbA
MKNFRRALGDAIKYWPWLVLAWACSAGVATLWTMNIAAAFPILEVTLRGEAPQHWNEARIADARKQVERFQSEVRQAEDALAHAPSGDNSLQVRLNDAQMNLQGAQVRLHSVERLQPWLEAYVPRDPFRVILAIAGMLILSMVVKQVLQVSSGMIVATVSQKIARRLRERVFDKALEMDRGTFLEIGQSGFTAQTTSTSDALATGINNVFGSAVSEPLKLIACLVGAACISWRLLLATMVFAPIGAFAVLWLNRKLRSTAKRMLQQSLGFHHVLLEALHSMLTVQAYTMEHEERRRFRRSTGDMMRFALRAHLFNTLASPMAELIGVFMICLAIVLGAQLTLRGQLTVFGLPLFDKPLGVSAMMVFFGMLLGAFEPVRRMAGVVAGINTGMVAADVIYPLLDRKSLVRDPAQPKAIASPHREITLNNVTFGYDPAHPVLRNVSLSIPFGQTLAVIGPNGGGKSTMVGLLCRFYDPQQGELAIDGISLRDLSIRDLRSRIALVTQHTELFNESIYYNIRYGRWNATEQEVIEAAKLARADEFIQQFPHKYHTRTGPNGLCLSGGQRQRIVLARALLRQPEILILDEATSQIDVDSERVIHDVLASFGKTRTIIIITHRESALKLADRVIRIDRGTLEDQPLQLPRAA